MHVFCRQNNLDKNSWKNELGGDYYFGLCVDFNLLSLNYELG